MVGLITTFWGIQKDITDPIKKLGGMKENIRIVRQRNIFLLG